MHGMMVCVYGTYLEGEIWLQVSTILYRTLSTSLYLSLLSSYVHREGREVKSQKDGGEKKKLLFCCQEEETA